MKKQKTEKSKKNVTEQNAPAIIDACSKIARKREEVKAIKAMFAKLGNETEAVVPTDIEVMYLAKLCDNSMRNLVRNENALSGYIKAYKGEISEEVELRLKAYAHTFDNDFNSSKTMLESIIELHPLWQKLKDIKGLSTYQLGMIIMFIKDPARFDTASKLTIYAGQGCYGDIPVNKANINKISEKLREQGKFNEDRTKFGFNTKFSGRLYVISECLMRSGGYFYFLYTQIKERLRERCLTNNECFEMTEEMAKELNEKAKNEKPPEIPDDLPEFEKQVMIEEFNKKKEKFVAGKLYMKGKKNQSLDMFLHVNCRRRMMRTLLHIIYTEWRTIKGLTTRIPYAQEYLGHMQIIKLEDVLNYDRNISRKEDE